MNIGKYLNDIFIDKLSDKHSYCHISDVVNNGYCYIWAYMFKNIKNSAVIVSSGSHTFIKYGGQFYDSAMFNGTNNLLDISDTATDKSTHIIHENINDIFSRYGKNEVLKKLLEITGLFYI